eukprot:Sspe_Gene.38681::Locus_18651_Transcript_1_1_Confidence_1.000_Length_3133::g.38681::m.38681
MERPEMEPVSMGVEFARKCTKFRGQIIGQGGYGTVYKGQNMRTGEFVAIKEIKAEGAAKAVLQETIREYQMLMALQHENIVKTYAFTYQDGIASIYMEYMSEGSLVRCLNNYHDGIPEITIRKYVTDVLKGLQFAHSRGVIHRDIKPANMLVDTGGGLKLADFGLCKKVSDHTSVDDPHSIKGTIRYMSPKAIQRGYDVTSDLWAVGCSVVEMATGRPPYSNCSLQNQQLLYQIAQRSISPEIPRTAALQPISSRLREFIKACLSEDPSLTCETLLEHDFITTEVEEPPTPPTTPSTPPRVPTPPGIDKPSMSGNITPIPVTITICRPMPNDDSMIAQLKGITGLLSRELSRVQDPHLVILELIKGGCGDGVDSLEHQRCILHTSIRLLAVLFCTDPLTGKPHYADPSVQHVVDECTNIVEKREVVLDELERSGTNINGLQFITEAVKSGLELLRQAGQEDASATSFVEKQRAASEAFLTEYTGVEHRISSLMNRYKFLWDRREHATFTKIFLLLTSSTVSMSHQGSDSVIDIQQEITNHIRDTVPDDWVVLYAALEHLLQLALVSSQNTVHYDAYSGSGESYSLHSNSLRARIGLRNLIWDPHLRNELDMWRVREKVVECVLVLLHVKLPVGLHYEVKQDARKLFLPYVMATEEQRVKNAFEMSASMRLHHQCRPAMDWTATTYCMLDNLPEDVARAIRQPSSALTKQTNKFQQLSGTLLPPPPPPSLYGPIFRNDAELDWSIFFQRLANTPPHHPETFHENYGHLVDLVKALMQSNSVQRKVSYEGHYFPFTKEYFPGDRMMEDIKWLDDRQFFLVGDRDQANIQLDGAPKGAFLIRPSSKQGRLVASVVPSCKRPSSASSGGKLVESTGTTHKLVMYKTPPGHLVIDRFKATHNEATRPIRGLREFVQWLLESFPHDFRIGAGRRQEVGQYNVTDFYGDS